MLAALILESLSTSIYLAYGAFLAGWTWIHWQVTMVLVTALGTLAFMSAGRFVESALFLVASPLVNLGYFCAALGIATVEPLLVIPLHVALNGAYLIIVWCFLLRRQASYGLAANREQPKLNEAGSHQQLDGRTGYLQIDES